MNETFKSKQATVKLNRQTTKKLTAIADHYGNDNILHQLNIIVDSLFKALNLEGGSSN
jgi:molecular chaperone GrpE (heat shock protein)